MSRALRSDRSAPYASTVMLEGVNALGNCFILFYELVQASRPAGALRFCIGTWKVFFFSFWLSVRLELMLHEQTWKETTAAAPACRAPGRIRVVGVGQCSQSRTRQSSALGARNLLQQSAALGARNFPAPQSNAFLWGRREFGQITRAGETRPCAHSVASDDVGGRRHSPCRRRPPQGSGYLLHHALFRQVIISLAKNGLIPRAVGLCPNGSFSTL